MARRVFLPDGAIKVLDVSGVGVSEPRKLLYSNMFLFGILHSAMGRICLPYLYREVPFCDVILADILTSFSRILGDLHVTFCDLVLEPGTNLVSRVESSLHHLTPRDLPTNGTGSVLLPRATKAAENLAGLRAPIAMAAGPEEESFWGINDVVAPLIIS